MLMIVDKENRRIVEMDLESREEAEARLTELLEEDPSAKGILVIMTTLDA